MYMHITTMLSYVVLNAFSMPFGYYFYSNGYLGYMLSKYSMYAAIVVLHLKTLYFLTSLFTIIVPSNNCRLKVQ
jgi:hypothetical protein